MNTAPRPGTGPILNPRQHVIFWMGAAAFFILLVWLFNGILLPFILGLAIAYLLEPVVRLLRNNGINRTGATLLILSLFVLFIALVMALVMPIAYREMTQLANELPDYAERAWAKLVPYIGWAQERLGQGNIENLQETLKGQMGKLMTVSGSVLTGLASGGQAVAGFITAFVLTPIVAYYMMKEWPVMTKWIDDLIPRHHYDTVRGLLKEIDTKLAGFIRGQLTVAFILAVTYAIALSIAGLNYGFLIGLMAGVLSIIPLVGSTIGLLVSVGVAWFQEGTWTYTAIIAAIFLIGQFIEGNFLSPRLLGKSVGLHPLWVLFALLAGGALFGIVGMLLAVPVVAVVGVLAGFAVNTYKSSTLYKDEKQNMDHQD